MSSAYLEDLIILLVAAVAVVPVCQTLKLGAVPGFLIAGLVVGPSGLGLVNNLTEISHFAEIGIAFLLFVIGIELKPSRLWQMRRMVFGLGTLQVVITGLALVAISYYVFDIPFKAAAIIGPALALSSTAFVLQLLSEQHLLKSTYGRTSFSILLLQDLAVVPLLAFVTLLGLPEFSLGDDIGLALAES
ncbi:MAG: cation:proton antiporter, partial [Cycloclasticus sp.]|nr:cation:proton antiporter [Cycloclasticus sp.]